MSRHKPVEVGDLVTFKQRVYKRSVYTHLKGLPVTVAEVDNVAGFELARVINWADLEEDYWYGPWWPLSDLKPVKVPK